VTGGSAPPDPGREPAAPVSAEDAAPVSAEDFAAAMAAFAPFEPAPLLAVAVSGGADSLALCLLADAWARRRGGTVLALTVDHRLRPGSAGEAGRVAAWLGARGIAHETLVWADPPAAGPIQAAARAARYALLEQACAACGALHLLLGHTLDDQAETVLMRLAKGSGADGLAGMPAVRELGAVRLLRPLLDVGKARLAATCRAAGQPWLEDPSNAGARFARGRLRQVAPALSAEGLTPARLADTARRLGQARAALDAATADLLARAAEVRPEGWLILDGAALAAAPAEVRLRALARCLRTIGGEAVPPRRERLERLAGEIAAGGPAAGRTLAGCCVLPRGESPRPGAGRALLVCREPAAADERRAAAPGATVCWDRRFRVTVPVAAPAAGLAVARLGAAAAPAPGLAALPAAVRPSLPALWNDAGPVGLPEICGGSTGQNRMTGGSVMSIIAEFTPTEAVAGAPYGVV